MEVFSILRIILPTYPTCTERTLFERGWEPIFGAGNAINLVDYRKRNKRTSHLTNLVNMEACCSSKSFVGSSCGFDAKDRKRQTQNVPIPFLSCTKNISKHWSTLSFSGLQNEINFVLSRAALFDQAEERIKLITICPRHRATLGRSWTYKRRRNKVQNSPGHFRTWKIKSSRQSRMLPQRIQPAGHERTSQRYQVAFRRDFSDSQGGKGSCD